MLLLFEDLYGCLWRDMDAEAHADTYTVHRVPQEQTLRNDSGAWLGANATPEVAENLDAMAS